MSIHPELKATLLWAAATSAPLALIGFYLGNTHAGPGGYYFYAGMVLLFPMFTLGSSLSRHVPHDLVLPILLAAQFTYWALFVFAIRWLWHNCRSKRS